ncbi:ATP-binding protein [Actinoallomurus sp. CA-142502]|uniref:ATP-binding protein n=1 Tax=Actinoallomurus sp. CA-142502 TaxID=3239885 RepID=UPI003D8C48A0
MVSDLFTLTLAPAKEAARQARSATTHFLRELDMKELLDDATLVVSELTTNATKLGQKFRLRLIVNERTLRIEVSDHSVDEPIVRARIGDDRAEDGRGLLVVAALADAWGFDVLPDGGKTVWAVLTCR